MAAIKYTKTELRIQQLKLKQLEKYLPTLQLKKATLQFEIIQATSALEELSLQKGTFEQEVKQYQLLLSDPDADDLEATCLIEQLKVHFENIAGVEVPIFEDLIFKKPEYYFFDTPFWLDSGISGVKRLIEAREKIKVFHERKALLEQELREVSIRVNLFEKVMIPRTKENIKKIKIFLGDQQLAAVAQAKVSKRKIALNKQARKK